MGKIMKKEIRKMIVPGGNMEKLIREVSKKQESVRTTFTLSKEGNEALNALTKGYKRKIKQLVDGISNEVSQEKEQSGKSLIIMSVKHYKDKLKREVRRSMVLSEKSLNILNAVAKDNGVPRDVILDRGFFIIYVFMKTSLKTRLEEHEKALKKIEHLQREAEKTERELKKTLDEEDPVLMKLVTIIIELGNLIIEVQEELKSGTPIEGEITGFKVIDMEAT